MPGRRFAPWKLGPNPKRRVVFQISIFRCELLVSGRVIYYINSKIPRNSRHMSHAFSGQTVPALPLVWELCRIRWKLMHGSMSETICSKYVGGIIGSLLSWYECHHIGGNLVRKTWHISIHPTYDQDGRSALRDFNRYQHSRSLPETLVATCRMGCLPKVVGILRWDGSFGLTMIPLEHTPDP